MSRCRCCSTGSPGGRRTSRACRGWRGWGSGGRTGGGPGARPGVGNRRGLPLMVRLGLQLTLHSGREAFTRLLLTTVAVALGVAVLLGVFAEFHAFQADANRSCWECTQGATVPKALGTRGELWNYS